MLPQWIELTPEEEAALDEADTQMRAELQAQADALGVTLDELLARQALPRPAWIPRTADDGSENDSQLGEDDSKE